MFKIIFIVMLLSVLSCASKPVQVVLTPLTVVRDVIDLPLASMATFFKNEGEEYLDDPRNWYPTAEEIVYGYKGIDIECFFYPIGCVIGSVDYLTCRSLFPNFPRGVNPWKKTDRSENAYPKKEDTANLRTTANQSWGDFLFPNTQAIWNIKNCP